MRRWGRGLERREAERLTYGGELARRLALPVEGGPIEPAAHRLARG